MDLPHERSVVTLGKDLVADTTAETTSAVEDMSGFDEIEFEVKLGDVDAAAILTFAVKENTASSVSSPTPTTITLIATSAGVIVAGALVVTELSANLDDKILRLIVKKSAMTKRYIFLSITATVESYEVDSIVTRKSAARVLPVTASTDVYATAYAAK
jgi:hypothetical protein